MGKAEVFMAVMGISLFLLSFSGSPALAANSTVLDVTAPSDADINEEFLVTAVYRNYTNLCGASCRVDGGWLSGYTYLSETPGCEYSVTLQAPGYSGIRTLDVYCEKAGYDHQTEYFDIDIDKLGSDLSVVANPTSPYPGDTVTVNAFYEDDYNDVITGGSCSAEVRENGMMIRYVGMSRYGGSYEGDFVLPGGTGNYAIAVTCTSNQYRSASKSVSFEVTKDEAGLVLTYPEVVYYGQDVEVNADYNHMGSLISGSCTISLGGTEEEMGYSYDGYGSKVSIPYAAGPHSIWVECSSASYETRKEEILISPSDRPTEIYVISPIGKAFYPTDTIPVNISCVDSLTGKSMTGARCFLDELNQLEVEEWYHATEVSNPGVGTHSFSIECFEEFHRKGTGTVTVDVVRIPVDVRFIETGEEYRPGEEIKVKVVAVSAAGDNENVSCSARVDSYGPLFGNLVDYYTEDMVMEEGVHALAIEDSGKSSRMVVSVTCSGDIHEEKTARIEISAKQLSKETEEGAILLLSAVSVILVALILLIRRKLKIL